MGKQLKKYIKLHGNEAILGRIFSDGSMEECIRLYVDINNIFQIEFLSGSNISYTFLPECTELLEILCEGIVGVSISIIGQELVRRGYKSI